MSCNVNVMTNTQVTFMSRFLVVNSFTFITYFSLLMSWFLDIVFTIFITSVADTAFLVSDSVVKNIYEERMYVLILYIDFIIVWLVSFEV